MMSSVHKWNDSRIFYKEASSLSKNYDVELHAVADFEFKRINNINIHGLKEYDKRCLRGLNSFRLFKRALRAKSDYYHFHDPELIPVGLLLKIFTNGKVIYDIHEDYEEGILSKEWINIKLRKIVSTAFSKFEKFSSKFFDCNINVIDHIEEKFKSKGSKTCIIKNYPILSNVARENDVFHNDKINIVYAGAITKIRGMEEMLEAMDYLKSDNINLILLGNCHESVLDKINKKSQVDSRVKYLGTVDHERVVDILGNSDIGLVCLHKLKQYNYALPIKLFEYMNSELAIVATKMPYWHEQFKHVESISFIEEVTGKEIADAITKIIRDKDLLRNKTKKSYEYCMNQYNWAIEEKKLLELYDRL